MAITFSQLEKHLHQQGKWQGFGGLRFEVRLLTVTEALGSLNAWSMGKQTIRDYVAKELVAGTLTICRGSCPTPAHFATAQ
jgi:hypothetical protein